MTRFVYQSFMLAFVAMAVFGAFGAAHGMAHGIGCFAATAAGMPCAAGITESVRMHFDALRFFSTAVFAISLAIAFLIVFVHVLRVSVPPNNSRAVFASFTLPTANYRLLALLPWLSRFEHSPSSVV